MLDQLPALALLFLLIFGLNVIPAFAPPTWMALAFVGFRFPGTSPLLLALVGAVAATSGRLVLARLSHWLVWGKLLSGAHLQNVNVIRDRLEKRRVLTSGAVLLFAFGPLPSNFLFIAYGLTGLPMLRVALPFLVGRIASYAFFATSGAAVGRRFSFGPSQSTYYAIAYFLASQILIMGALYVFTRVDWKALLDRRKLVWVSHPNPAADMPHPGTLEPGRPGPLR